jgi:PAS domain S-box-containing protein
MIAVAAERELRRRFVAWVSMIAAAVGMLGLLGWALVLGPRALGWLALLGPQSGFYPPQLEVGLFASSIAVFFTLLAVGCAQALARMEAARRCAETELLRAETELEYSVSQREQLVEAKAQLQGEIHDREQGERDPREAHALWHSILHCTNLSVIATSEDGMIREFNACAERWLGYAAAEVVGRVTPALFHDPAEVFARASILSQELGRRVEPGFESFAAKARGGMPDESEWTYIRKDGARFPVLLSMTALRDRAGTVLGFLGIARDLAERTKGEQRFRSLIESAPEAIVITNDQGQIVLINLRAEAMFGYARAELLGASIDTLLPERKRAPHAAHRAKYIGAPQVRSMGAGLELFGRHKDGSDIAVDISLSPLHVGPRLEIVAAIVDVTEQRRARHELQRAKEAAEESARARSDFVARMSHEIRTPMNGVLGMVDLALQTGLTVEQRDYLSTARESADGLLGIINDVLDFSKIDAGKLQLEAIAFNLRGSLVSAMRGLAHRAHVKGLELLLDVPGQVPNSVIGDPQRLAQVVINLVGNAVKFTDRGGIMVTIAGSARSATQLELTCRVSDSGIGISAEKQGLIFEAFTQADEATNRRFGGTGLGLAISAQLVELMGGCIAVESALGQGTTFSFSVLLGLASPAEVEASAVLRGLRVLVVGDHRETCRVMVDLLATWGASAEACDTGEALARVRPDCVAQRPLDLLVLDVPAQPAPSEAWLQIASAVGNRFALLLLTPTVSNHGALATTSHLARVIKPVDPPVLLETIQAVVAGASPPVRPVTAPTTRIVAESRWRILVADDNRVNQKVAVALLTRAGHQVVLAGNGREALTALARESFDAVLMDVQMPEMDGLEATRTIRANERGTARHIAIVALTAQAMPGDRQQCLECGMDGYVTKPLDAGRLLAELERVMRCQAIP